VGPKREGKNIRTAKAFGGTRAKKHLKSSEVHVLKKEKGKKQEGEKVPGEKIRETPLLKEKNGRKSLSPNRTDQKKKRRKTKTGKSNPGERKGQGSVRRHGPRGG